MSYTQITPREYPITDYFVKNDDWRIEIPVVDATDGDFTFTGWTATAHVRVNKHATTSVVTFSSYDLTLELIDGYLILIQDKSQTGIDAKMYVWDCEFIDADGRHRTLILPSDFEVLEDVTD